MFMSGGGRTAAWRSAVVLRSAVRSGEKPPLAPWISASFRAYATDPKAEGTSKLDIQRPRSILEEVLDKPEEQPKTTAQKVKKSAENTFFYVSLGVAVCALGGLTYLIFEQFFASSSPQRIYTKALKMIRDDPQCQDALGEGIAGFGEQGRRARRHIASQAYTKDGEERVRVTFHVKGQRNAGRAFVEIAKKAGEGWDCRFLLVELADRSGTLVVVDNR